MQERVVGVTGVAGDGVYLVLWFVGRPISAGEAPRKRPQQRRRITPGHGTGHRRLRRFAEDVGVDATARDEFNARQERGPAVGADVQSIV